MVATFLKEYPGHWPQVGRVCSIAAEETELQWFTGSTTTTWKPLNIPILGGKGHREPWKESVANTTIISLPFKLTKTGRLPGEIQTELRELKDKYVK